MLHRFLPLAALIYVSVSLPAHAQAQQGAAGAVSGRIVDSVTGRAVPTATVHLMCNQRVHGTGEADTVGEFSFDHVPEGVYSIEVEETGAGNLTSRGLHLNGPRIHARWAFMATAPSSRSRLS